MNCLQANKYPIKQVLELHGKYPQKENSYTGFFFALDRDEKSPSLHVDYKKNTAFDFGTGRKFDVVSIVQIIHKCTVVDALKIIASFSFSEQNYFSPMEISKGYTIEKVCEIENWKLKNYLKDRRLDTQSEHLCEVVYKYKSNEKSYYGVGFKNDSGGFEFSNSLGFKRCLGKKDVTSIIKDTSSLKVFESWSDYLSYLVIYNNTDFLNSDFIVLNSTSMVHKVEGHLDNYERIELYLDNDNAGSLATANLIKCKPNIEDCRLLYRDYKDLNEMLKASF